MHESESDSDVDWSVIDSQEEGLDVRSAAGFDVESRMSRSLDLGLRDTDSQHFGAVSPSHHSLECSDVGTSVFHQPRTACNGVSPPGTCNNKIDVGRIAAPELNQGDKITTKLKSVWHNMRFGNSTGSILSFGWLCCDTLRGCGSVVRGCTVWQCIVIWMALL